MKKILVAFALACFVAFPAEAAVQLADGEHARRASVLGEVSVLVLVRDASGKNLFKNARETIAASALGQLAAIGAQAASPEIPQGEQTKSLPASLSPAEAIGLFGADYALALQLAAPVETPRNGTIYARQNVFYTLFDAAGKVADCGRVSKIFDSDAVDDALREIRVRAVAELAVAELEKKIADGKVVLKAMQPDHIAETEIATVVQSVRLPQILENKDGTFVFTGTYKTASLPGVKLKIGGLDYTLSPDGEATEIPLPHRQALSVFATHPGIEPHNGVVRIDHPRRKIVLTLSLAEAARKQWEKDSNEISQITAKEKLNAADVARIRAIERSWENFGITFTIPAPRKIRRNAAISERTSPEPKPEK